MDNAELQTVAANEVGKLGEVIGQKKMRKPIDQTTFEQEMVSCAEKKMTLSQFVADTSKRYGWNSDTVMQKYYKYRKDLQKASEDTSDAKKQEDAKFWLAKLEFVSGRGEGSGAGRKKVDRLASLNALRVKLGEAKAHTGSTLGQGQIKIGEGVFMEKKDHKLVIESHGTTITIDQDQQELAGV